jgi:hypothetical protein
MKKPSGYYQQTDQAEKRISEMEISRRYFMQKITNKK